MNLDIIKQVLKENGLKVTEPRCLMLEILSSAKHLNAEQLHDAVNEVLSVGLSSIYRNLVQLECTGLILKHQFKENIVYEINKGQHHDHLICNICGIVLEFVDEEIEIRQQKIAEKYGFDLHSHALNLYGTCSICNATKDESKCI